MNGKLGQLTDVDKAPAPIWAVGRAQRFVASFILALFFVIAFSSVAAAQIVLDGVINEPDWHQLGNSTGGPPPSFGAGHEINALYAEIDTTHLYIGVAGNVQFGNRILVFIDSLPGGYTNGNFGRASAPPGINVFNQNTQFDDGFTPNYVLSISTNNGQVNYFWDLYTLSGSFGSGGGPNLFLGDRNDADLRANPANSDQIRGFEARLTYSASGSGVDFAINQPEVRMMAMYINDAGTLSNQFITRANSGETGSYGNGQILFNTAAPGPVFFGHMLVVNEVDYIQPGANTAEFIELKNITNVPLSIDNFRLRFARNVNSPPEIYREIDLPNVIVNPGAYFVICTNAANVPNCSFTVEPPMDLLENAIPAAVALVQNNVIVDVISYGGNTGAPYTEISGVVPTDDGTQASLGISRIIDGMDTNRNSVDFGLRCITPGQTNSAQTGGCGPATPTFTPTFTPTPTGTSQTPTPTGTATPTWTPTPTGSVTATPTGSVTSPPPSGCTNVLTNGDFESAYGWEFGNDPVPGKYTSIPVHGGLRAVQLGNPPETGVPPKYTYSSIWQRVSTSYGSTVQLRFWHYYRTELGTNESPNNTQDRQEVILLKPNGDTLRIVRRVLRNSGGWEQSVIDLTEYAGHSFVLYFNAYNSGAGRTWMFLDDVELLVCGGATPVPYGYQTPNYGGATVSPTPTFTQQATTTPTSTPSATVVLTPTPSATSPATATPTSTPSPSPTFTPTPTETTMALAPSAPDANAVAQQSAPVAAAPQLAAQPVAPEQAAHQQAVALLAPTATAVLIDTRIAVPDNCVELIHNGSFEALGMGWSQEGSDILPEYAAPTLSEGGAASSGKAIRLGPTSDVAVTGISATQQLIQLPKDRNEITLKFRYFPLYEVPPTRGDFQYVDIYHGESGQFMGRALGIQQNDRVWIERTFDLSAFAGEPVRVFFMVSNDSVGGNIAMYVDDVSVLACRVEQPEAQNRVVAAAQEQRPAANISSTIRPLAGTSGGVVQPQATEIAAAISAAEIDADAAFPFGRMGGVLAVLGIAGAALVLLPLTRRFTK